jgi:hypothetical protein
MTPTDPNGPPALPDPETNHPAALAVGVATIAPAPGRLKSHDRSTRQEKA